MDENKILTSLNGYQIVDTDAREDIAEIQTWMTDVGSAIETSAIDELFAGNI